MTNKISEKLQKWLSDEALFRKKIPDDKANFHFTIVYPENSNNTMDIVQPKGKDDLVIVGCGTSVHPEYISKIKKLSIEDREKFLWEFRFLLNNPFVDFSLQHPDNILQAYLITDTIFEDGLSKDRLISSIKNVFKIKLLGIWKIQMELGILKGEESNISSEIGMYG